MYYDHYGKTKISDSWKETLAITLRAYLGNSQVHALPFSSLPKYFVHLSFRESLLNFKELFLHLLEQNHKIDPSFFTYIIPVPAGNSLPQNEHSLGFGKDNLLCYLDSNLSPSNLSGFSFSLFKHQKVLNPHGPFDIARYDTTLVFSSEDAHSHLRDLTGHTSTSNNLDYLRWRQICLRDFSSFLTRYCVPPLI
jgi:hypothetical protein